MTGTSTGSTCARPIESTFAMVRHRTKITKGPGSRAAGLAMAFRLIESAQDRWRAVNAPHLVALIRAGAVFVNGELVERPGEDAPPRPPEVHRRPAMTPGLRDRLHGQRHEATMLEDPCGRCSRS